MHANSGEWSEELRVKNEGFITARHKFFTLDSSFLTLNIMPGIYVHIPFCRSRCIYCGFYSTTALGMRHAYTKAVCREMELRKDYIHGEFSTVYIGGGTPSQLDACDIERLFHYIYKVFNVAGDAEVTMECNPDDITPDFAGMLGGLPVNRVSMGVQTFSDARLRFLRRRHGADDAWRAVKTLRQAGISNISIDLMFGFPREPLDDWLTDIDHALSLGVEHISAYSLMYEEGTPMYEMLQRGEIKETDEELSLAMYDALADRLKAEGYEHYEISNFARPGFRSRHNSSYWRQEPYIGLGAAAHSFDLRSRQWNTADLNAYVEAVSQGRIPAEREELDARTTFDDIVTTALRTREGIDTDYVERSLGQKYKDHLASEAAPFIAQGLMEQDGASLRLTRRGIYISDSIMSSLMMV